MGILGAGWWADQHAQALATLEGFAVTGVNSGSLDTAAAFVAQHGGRVHADARALLAAPDVDAVLITAPHTDPAKLHASQQQFRKVLEEGLMNARDESTREGFRVIASARSARR